jgi:hypothetical protein
MQDKRSIHVILLTTLLCFSCFLGKVFFDKYQENARESCYQAKSKELNVDPTYVGIGNGLLAEMHETISVGMNEQEVMEKLNDISPTLTLYSDSSSTYFEIGLEICPREYINFILFFTNEGFFEEILLDTRAS